MKVHFPPPRPATPAELADIEKRMHAKLDPWSRRLSRASFAACDAVFVALLQFDFERGRVPGQRSGVAYTHSSAFVAWEESLWAALDARQAELDAVPCASR